MPRESKPWWSGLLAQSVTNLARVACMLALLALALMSYSIVSPRPLPVILAMSLGHVLGGAAFCLYLSAVLLDVWRNSRSTPRERPE
ncbi:MAG TPA: hypothetical protein VFQ61_08500 [Polyangiaceae bacterium]|nr:hypothetical protein [Polyangiaceae bacterium]